MKAEAPTSWNTRRYGAPEGRAREATYPAKNPITTQKMNHCTKYFPIQGMPFGRTVMIITGPLPIFSLNAGDFISSGPEQ